MTICNLQVSRIHNKNLLKFVVKLFVFMILALLDSSIIDRHFYINYKYNHRFLIQQIGFQDIRKTF